MGLSLEKIEDRDEHCKLLIYGPPGVGKTTFAAGAPNPVILDYENSSESLRGTPLANIDLAGTRKQLANYDDVLDFIKKVPDKYDTIIIDSVSSMYDTMLMEHMRKEKRDRHIALFYDFRKMTNVLKEIFYELVNIDKNVIIVSHETHLTDENNKILQIRPLLPPALRQSVERLVNEVFYLEASKNLTGGMERVLHVESQGYILAKNRQSHLLEAKIKNPTWKEVYNAN